MEPPEPGLMRRRPRRSTESMLSWSLGGTVIGQGVLLAAVGLAAFWLSYDQESDLDSARTMTFCVVVFAELFRALAARSQIWTFWQLGIKTNLYVVVAVVVSGLLQVGIIALPFVRPIFKATTHTPMEWGLLLALALTPVTVIESVKLGRQFFGQSNASDSAGESS
jgi:Ca2+-transporting ATPase